MWQSVYADQSTGWDWIVRNYTYNRDGGESSFITYHDIKIRFVNASRFDRRDKYGKTNTEVTHAIVPKFELTDDELTPKTQVTFLRKAGIVYRVIGVQDLTEDPAYFCYYLTLRRDELPS